MWYLTVLFFEPFNGLKKERKEKQGFQREVKQTNKNRFHKKKNDTQTGVRFLSINTRCKKIVKQCLHSSERK